MAWTVIEDFIIFALRAMVMDGLGRGFSGFGFRERARGLSQRGILRLCALLQPVSGTTLLLRIRPRYV